MGRGLQRLSPLFTAFIPVGQSLNPVTKANWENSGVEPEIKVPAEKALNEAHLAALRRLAEREAIQSGRAIFAVRWPMWLQENRSSANPRRFT